MELQIDGRAWRYGQEKEVRVYHLLGLDTTDIIMRGQSNTKTTMMDALVKEAKDAVLEKILEGQNEEASLEEEQEIDELAEQEIEASNDPDLKEKKTKPKKPTGKAKDEGKKKADSAVVDVPAKEKRKKKADAAVDVPAKTGSSSKPSTKKAADVEASGSKAANAETSRSKAPTTTSSKPAFVDLDDSDPDVPLGATTRRVKHPKRKASDVDPDEEPPKQVKGKGVDRERPPPSKKTKTTSTKPPSRMEKEGAAWKARKHAVATVITGSLAAVSSSGTTVTTPSSTPPPPGTSHFSLGLSISHSNINVAASIPPPSIPSGTTAARPSAATSSVQLSSERTMTTPPPTGPQTPSASPMRVVEQQVHASPLPSQSPARDDLMDFDQLPPSPSAVESEFSSVLKAPFTQRPRISPVPDEGELITTRPTTQPVEYPIGPVKPWMLDEVRRRDDIDMGEGSSSGLSRSKNIPQLEASTDEQASYQKLDLTLHTAKTPRPRTYLTRNR